MFKDDCGVDFVIPQICSSSWSLQLISWCVASQDAPALLPAGGKAARMDLPPFTG